MVYHPVIRTLWGQQHPDQFILHRKKMTSHFWGMQWLTVRKRNWGYVHQRSAITVLYVEWCFSACLAASLLKKLVAHCMGQFHLCMTWPGAQGRHALLPVSGPHICASSHVHGTGNRQLLKRFCLRECRGWRPSRQKMPSQTSLPRNCLLQLLV